MIIGAIILAFMPAVLVVGQLKLSHILDQLTKYTEENGS